MMGRKYMGNARTTFVIDKDGRIAHVFEKVKPEGPRGRSGGGRRGAALSPARRSSSTAWGLPHPASHAHRSLIAETPMPTPSTTKKLDELYALIDGIEIAMFTTRRADGQLVSRPMATQERVTGTDLWFVTDISSSKLDDLAFDPHVNLAYYNNKSREWVSVAGTAQVTQDRNLIKELYRPDWKAWFGDEGGDPRRRAE